MLSPIARFLILAASLISLGGCETLELDRSTTRATEPTPAAQAPDTADTADTADTKTITTAQPAAATKSAKPPVAKKPQVEVLESANFAQAKALHMQALVRSGAKPLAPAEVGYYMDVQNAQFIQQLRVTDIDIRHEGDLIILTLPGGDSFDPNSTRLKPAAMRNLVLTAQVLTEYAQTRITIHGHTDDTGEAKYNQWLSVRRALSVTGQLLKAGVATRRIAVIGFGENSPLVPNTTPDGRARNRRIELYLEPIAN